MRENEDESFLPTPERLKRGAAAGVELGLLFSTLSVAILLVTGDRTISLVEAVLLNVLSYVGLGLICGLFAPRMRSYWPAMGFMTLGVLPAAFFLFLVTGIPVFTLKGGLFTVAGAFVGAWVGGIDFRDRFLRSMRRS